MTLLAARPALLFRRARPFRRTCSTDLRRRRRVAPASFLPQDVPAARLCGRRASTRREAARAPFIRMESGGRLRLLSARRRRRRAAAPPGARAKERAGAKRAATVPRVRIRLSKRREAVECRGGDHAPAFGEDSRAGFRGSRRTYIGGGYRSLQVAPTGRRRSLDAYWQARVGRASFARSCLSRGSRRLGRRRPSTASRPCRRRRWARRQLAPPPFARRQARCLLTSPRRARESHWEEPCFRSAGASSDKMGRHQAAPYMANLSSTTIGASSRAGRQEHRPP